MIDEDADETTDVHGPTPRLLPTPANLGGAVAVDPFEDFYAKLEVKGPDPDRYLEVQEDRRREAEAITPACEVRWAQALIGDV